MKIRTNLICICAIALLAPGIVSPLRAQSDQPRVANRLLLVFDTSSGMKKRIPNEEKAVNALFEITLNGKLHPGDSVGIWTFSRDLHLGQFPQQDWFGGMINTLPPEIAGFLKKQHYSKDTSFDELIRTLNEVVRESPRLTTVIFCDGDGQVSGIPGADGINASFKQHAHLMEKARMPFVIVLRSQFDSHQVGHYVGCTISSASSIVLPQFPPMPPPPQPPPTPAPAKVVPQAPPPVVAPLIVIGTNSESNPPPAPLPTAPPPQREPVPAIPPAAAPVSPANPAPPAVSPPPSVPMAQTNSTPPPAAEMQPITDTNTTVLPSQAPARPMPPAAAAAAPVPPENSREGKEGYLAAGAGAFVVVVAIVYLLFRRSRGRDSSSLITESLKKR